MVLHTRSRATLVILALCVWFAGKPAALRADAPTPKPQAGEIRLDGTLRSIDAAAGTLVLDVASFTLPDGKVGRLTQIKPKTVHFDGKTVAHAHDDPTVAIKLNDLTPGTAMLVIGPFAGTGQDMTAREIGAGEKAAAAPSVATPIVAPAEAGPAAVTQPVALAPADPVVPAEPAVDGPKPEMVLQIGHSAGIAAMAISPDGRTIVTGSTDHTVKFWDTASGEIQRNLPVDGGGLSGIAVSKDGKLLAASDRAGFVNLYNYSDLTLLHHLQMGDSAWSLALSANGKQVACGGVSGGVKVWDCASGKLLRSWAAYPGTSVCTLAFSPDGQAIATGTRDYDGKVVPGDAKLWLVDTGEELRSLTGHQGGIYSLAFSPDGKTLATASNDKTIKLWNLADGTVTRTIADNRQGISSLAFSPDGATLAGGCLLTDIKLWAVNTGAVLQNVTGAHDDEIKAIGFTPDGASIVTVSNDMKGKVWDAATAQLKVTLEPATGISVRNIAISPDGSLIASCGSSPVVRLWSTHDGTLARSLVCQSPVRAVAFSPDGATIATGGLDGVLTLWNAAKDGSKTARTPQAGGIDALAFSPDGATLAAGGGDGNICLWDPATGEPIKTIAAGQRGFESIAFSPDGKSLATAAYQSPDGELKEWDVATGTLKRVLDKGKSINAVAFAPDGKTIAGGGNDAAVKFWDADTGEIAAITAREANITSVAFSPDGKTVAAGRADNSIQLWDSETQKPLATLTGSAGRTWTLAFSHDGGTLVSGSRDGIVRLWNLAAKQVVLTLRVLPTDDPDSNPWLVQSPDGAYNAGLSTRHFIRWRVGDHLFSAKTYEKQYRHPDAIAAISRAAFPQP